MRFNQLPAFAARPPSHRIVPPAAAPRPAPPPAVARRPAPPPLPRRGWPLAVRSYFTWALASLILEDRAAAIEQGESPVLQGDPFTGRREWDISDFSIDVKDTSAPKTVGTVTFVNFGKPERVVLELLRSGKEWRIADVEWDSGTLRGLYRRKAAYDGEAAR
jgi:hypothetical protein